MIVYFYFWDKMLKYCTQLIKRFCFLSPNQL